MIFTYKYLCYINVHFCDINLIPVILLNVYTWTVFHFVGKIALMANAWHVKIEFRL